LIVVEERLAAQAHHPARVTHDSESPDGDIDVVNAVVSHVAAAEIEPPAPHSRK
jgi:hypothetical protein